MKAVIYLDSYFFMNLVLNSMLLSLLRRIRRLKGSMLRILAASVFGGAGACFLLLYPSWGIFMKIFFTYLGIGGGMILIAFGFHGRKKFFQNLCWLTGITIGLGGIVQFLTEQYTGVFYLETGESTVMIAAAAGTAVMIWLLKKLTGWAEKESCLCSVTLFFEDRSVPVIGYLDSGNLLKEPVSGKPVMVLEESVFLELFKGQVREKMALYLEKEEMQWDLGEPYAERIRLVPYKSIGRKRGLLKGFIIDRMVAVMGEKDVELVRPVIAVYPGVLSSDQSYRMILPGTLQ